MPVDPNFDPNAPKVMPPEVAARRAELAQRMKDAQFAVQERGGPAPGGVGQALGNLASQGLSQTMGGGAAPGPDPARLQRGNMARANAQLAGPGAMPPPVAPTSKFAMAKPPAPPPSMPTAPAAAPRSMRGGVFGMRNPQGMGGFSKRPMMTGSSPGFGNSFRGGGASRNSGGR